MKTRNVLRVNCHVYPENSPYYFRSRRSRRATITVSREFETYQQVGTFLDNLQASGQLAELSGVWILNRTRSWNDSTEPLSREEFSAEKLDHSRNRDIW